MILTEIESPLSRFFIISDNEGMKKTCFAFNPELSDEENAENLIAYTVAFTEFLRSLE